MPAFIRANITYNRKHWYIWSEVDKHYPDTVAFDISREQFIEILRKELGLPKSLSLAEVVTQLAARTWDHWIL